MARKIYSILLNNVHAERREIRGIRFELAEEGTQEYELCEEAEEYLNKAESALTKLKNLDHD